jgi:hypothetical protein
MPSYTNGLRGALLMKLPATALCFILCSTSFTVNAADTFKATPVDPEPLNKKPQSESLRDFEHMVELCAKAVRGELPYSQFDAYVEGKSINMMGTEESRFKFYKCMSKNGIPLSPSKDSER